MEIINVIEFQKRGLPHAHILVILHEDDKPRTVEDYDCIVSAELPDPQTQPALHGRVTTHMLHMVLAVLCAPTPLAWRTVLAARPIPRTSNQKHLILLTHTPHTEGAHGSKVV